MSHILGEEEKLSLEDAIQHYGVLGMKWGVRKDRSERPGTKRDLRKAGYKNAREEQKSRRPKAKGTSRQEAVDANKAVSKSARAAMNDWQKATTPAEKAAATKKYEQEVYKQFRDPKFQAKFAKANSVSKGEMVTHTLLFGPFALATIPLAKAQRGNLIENSLQVERDVSAGVLNKMKKG